MAVSSKKLSSLRMPLVEATPESLAGYGRLVSDPEAQPIEIVTWPAQSWRPVDAGTGNEGGTVEGVFRFWWDAGALHGRNEAVRDQYLLGHLSDAPEGPSLLIRHANYHPDGGQLFHPMAPGPFVAPLALPGDDVKPADFIAFYCDGRQGLYLHPGVWHEAIVPLAPEATFLDRQGRVHARVSCHFDQEFGLELAVPLPQLSDKIGRAP